MPQFLFYISSLLPLLVVGAAFLLPLFSSRKDMLLGTRVSVEFNSSSAAEQIKRSYAVHAALLCATVIVLFALGAAVHQSWLYMASVVLGVAGLMFLRVSTWRTLKPYRVSRQAVRTASLDPSSQPASDRWWLPMIVALLPLLAAATLLTDRWQTIPERFSIHWGLDGQPNGWNAWGCTTWLFCRAT